MRLVVIFENNVYDVGGFQQEAARLAKQWTTETNTPQYEDWLAREIFYKIRDEPVQVGEINLSELSKANMRLDWSYMLLWLPTVENLSRYSWDQALIAANAHFEDALST